MRLLLLYTQVVDGLDVDCLSLTKDINTLDDIESSSPDTTLTPIENELEEDEDSLTSSSEDSDFEEMTSSGGSNNEQHSPNKRKCSWNLEDIVLKLKRSKKPSSLPQSPLPPEDIKNEDEDYVLSPVFPREMNDSEKSFLNEKSSFLTQLEQKDNLSLMENIREERKISDVNETSNDGSMSSGVSSDERDEAEQKLDKSVSKKADDLIRGDFQLAKLLEEEKLNGSEGDKIDETKCNKCNKRFYRRSQLIRHLSNHVVHECLQCNAVFYCVKKYKKHMNTHETYPCDFCNEEFYDASAWYQHRAKHTMIECSCCDMIFYNKTALAKHKFEHSEYVCPLCRFACENLHHWISHRNYHGRCSLLQPIIACRECKLTFGSQEVFLKHKCSKPPKSITTKPLQPKILTPKNLPPKMMTPKILTPKTSLAPLSSTKIPKSLPMAVSAPHIPISKPYDRRSNIPHTKSFFKDHLSRDKPFMPMTKNGKISRPDSFYFPSQKAPARHYPYSYPSKPLKPYKRGVMHKKDIKDLIGIDQTLACSS